MTRAVSVVVTAEHGGHDVPAEWAGRFLGFEDLLRSHRGWDPGSLDLARLLARRLRGTLVTATVTRLLVDLNRSPHHRAVFSDIARALDRGRRAALLERYHRPHRDRVADAVDLAIAAGQQVIHLGIHSFTPELDGVVRKPDLALLYDPARPAEKRFAGRWARDLAARAPGYVVRRNDPYRGSADGLTRTLRGRHADELYVGIEVEVNQRHVGSDGRFPAWVGDALSESFLATTTATREAG